MMQVLGYPHSLNEQSGPERQGTSPRSHHWAVGWTLHPSSHNQRPLPQTPQATVPSVIDKFCSELSLRGNQNADV